MKEFIEFKNFTFKYDAQVSPTLYDINLKIKQGEKILIVGPSGCGKSTLSNCLNGLIPFVYPGEYSGEVVIDSLEFSKANIFDLSKKVGTVLQDPDGQFVGLTVGEDIAFALENDMVAQDEIKQKVKEMATVVDMDKMISANPFNCSGGQKQRVSVAGVMAMESPILLFDEPLANLDPKTGKVAIDLIDNLHKLGKTVIIIEHRLEDVLYRDVDRIIVMSEGRIVMDDSPDAVLSCDILSKCGIREPLYLTACKYAGVNIIKDMKPSRIEKFDISGQEDKLYEWYKENTCLDKETTKDPILEISNLSFDYDGTKKVLDNVSLKVQKGEMMAIVGKNGAGKSTLSKVIVGFLKPKDGTILLDGNDIKDLTIKERGEQIGIVLQNPNQMISKTFIYDEIAFGLRNRGMDEEEIKEKVYDVMKICALYKFRKWPISALSFGQKRRVCIASILVMNPKIIILDEPTAGQDFAHYSEIMDFLKSLNENGQTIILITHDMHLMLEYTKRACAFCDGKIVADKTAYEILCDNDLVEKANLKETSLFTLGEKLKNVNPLSFVECFINAEKKRRA